MKNFNIMPPLHFDPGYNFNRIIEEKIELEQGISHSIRRAIENFYMVMAAEGFDTDRIDVSLSVTNDFNGVSVSVIVDDITIT